MFKEFREWIGWNAVFDPDARPTELPEPTVTGAPEAMDEIAINLPQTIEKIEDWLTGVGLGRRPY